MLIEQIEGKTVADVQQFTTQQMLDLFGPRLTPNRQKCCLLPWRVLQSAIFSPIEDGRPRPDGASLSDPQRKEPS